MQKLTNIEFQNRGSSHIHCLVWVADAPVFGMDDESVVCNYVSKYIKAQLPNRHRQPNLYKKVTEVQIHSKKHTHTCSKGRGTGCRFGFPKPPVKTTTHQSCLGSLQTPCMQNLSLLCFFHKTTSALWKKSRKILKQLRLLGEWAWLLSFSAESGR